MLACLVADFWAGGGAHPPCHENPKPYDFTPSTYQSIFSRSPSGITVPAGIFSAPDWSLIGPVNTLYEPSLVPSTIFCAAAFTSSGIFGLKGDISTKSSFMPPQTSPGFQVPSSTACTEVT